MECCRIRSRDEAHCEELPFTRPAKSNQRVELENKAMLVNGIAIDGATGTFRVRVRFFAFFELL
jgi:hypothetical protein